MGCCFLLPCKTIFGRVLGTIIPKYSKIFHYKYCISKTPRQQLELRSPAENLTDGINGWARTVLRQLDPQLKIHGLPVFDLHLLWVFISILDGYVIPMNMHYIDD